MIPFHFYIKHIYSLCAFFSCRVYENKYILSRNSEADASELLENIEAGSDLYPYKSMSWKDYKVNVY